MRSSSPAPTITTSVRRLPGCGFSAAGASNPGALALLLAVIGGTLAERAAPPPDEAVIFTILSPRVGGHQTAPVFTISAVGRRWCPDIAHGRAPVHMSAGEKPLRRTKLMRLLLNGCGPKRPPRRVNFPAVQGGTSC